MGDIFVSYAREDHDKAKVLAESLGERGWTVWWDRKIPPGKSFDQVIKLILDSRSISRVAGSADFNRLTSLPRF